MQARCPQATNWSEKKSLKYISIDNAGVAVGLEILSGTLVYGMESRNMREQIYPPTDPMRYARARGRRAVYVYSPQLGHGRAL